MDISTVTTTTPRVDGGNNYETYWVGGSNLLPVTRDNSIQAWRPNYFCSASIIVRNWTESLPDKKNIPLDESKSKITLASWTAWIMSYMEDNGMNTIVCVYDPDIKTEIYPIYYLGAAKDGKVSKWVQSFTTMGVQYRKVNYFLHANLTETILLGP